MDREPGRSRTDPGQWYLRRDIATARSDLAHLRAALGVQTMSDAAVIIGNLITEVQTLAGQNQQLITQVQAQAQQIAALNTWAQTVTPPGP